MQSSGIYDNGDSGSSKTIDWSHGDVQALNLSADCTLTFSNGMTGKAYILLVSYSGSYVPTFPSSVDWGADGIFAPSGSGKIDACCFLMVGTSYQGSYKPGYDDV